MKQKLLYVFLMLYLCFTGSMNGWALEQDANGVYQIGTAQDLKDFAALVNGGEFGANAVLTSDIVLTDVWEFPIGTGGGAYTGSFDGQGHKITGFEGTSNGKFGLFGFISQATVQNFSIAGKLTATNTEGSPEGGSGTDAHGAGTIGWSEGSHISGVHSELEITVADPNVHHVGGVIGSAQYNNVIRYCSFSGSLREQYGNTDCFGGVVGYMGNDSIINCANYGTVSFFSPSAYAGGILGYLNNTEGTIKGCLNTGNVAYADEGTPSYGGAIIGRLRGNTPSRLQNNVWLEGSAITGSGENKVSSTLCATAEQLASGAVCYYMNTDQSEIGWYQTLSTDKAPVLDATHAQVYMNGRQHCNGDAYDDVVYSNENTGMTKDEHDIVDGFCSYCGFFDESYLTPNADGYYEISTAKHLAWFERMVNMGKDTLNAVLTDDIDFGPLTEDPDFVWVPIGDWGGNRGTASAAYRGHFDGQGHTIKNFNVTASQNYFGIFGVISNGAVIENFTIYGDIRHDASISTAVKTSGVVGYTRDTPTTIRNIHSYLNIYNSVAGARPGGILGSANNGTTIIENCTYSGTLDGNDAGGNGNYGGIVGYVNNSTAAILNITNCLFDGKVVNTNESPGGCTFGGFVGYSNSGIVTIKNCLSIGVVESVVYGMYFGAVKQSKSALTNCYYVGEPVNGTASTVNIPAIETNEVELASGEIAWKLNGETFVDVAWHQTLEENYYPVLDAKAAIIYQTPLGYECISEGDPESVSDFINSVIANEQVFIEDDELVAYQALVEAYRETIKSWEDIDNYNDFIAAYKASAPLKESIKTSAATYAAYVKACETAASYIEENSLEGKWTEFLLTYLGEDAVEPGNDYPNGSYSYIMEKLGLDDEALTAEIEFVNQMLENAIAGGITSGTEVTRLMKNPTFADAFEGWTTEAADGATFATGGEAEIMKIARGKNGTFDIRQTLTDIPNGIYMMALNGLFCAGDDNNSLFYAGQLYLNGTGNYFMSPSEDLIPTSEAVDKVNSYLENDEEIVTDAGDAGYVPTTVVGCSYAYGAGRYVNYCAAEVTDSTLTVGMRSLGTGLDGDWMPFGNLHVYYLGTAEEANEKLTDVLEAFAERAQVIVDFVCSDGYEDVASKPNISEELKGQLSEAIAAVDNAATGEAKMELINRFSELFLQVHACRKAYITMLKACGPAADVVNTLADNGFITDDEYYDWQDYIQTAVDHFTNGDVTAEEALTIAEKLNIIDKLLPSVDGIYQLGTATQVQLFAMIVNSGQGDAKAVMTNDIDMSDVEVYSPIGTYSSNPFTGVFDGQGYKITNFGKYDEENDTYSLEMSGDGQGFIGYASKATIKNFSISGAISYSGGTGVGAIGWATGTALSNVHSALNIAVVSTSHHIGGVCGHLSENSSATNCSFAGSITEKASSHDCIGGIGAYSNNGVSYTNCANYGTITYSAANAYAGGICGYVNNDSFTGVFNCLNAGTVQLKGGSPSYGGAFVGRLRSHSGSKFENNYMLQGSAPGTSGENAISANIVSAEQLSSGEVCFKLNGDQAAINWFQTLGEDLYPVLDDTHKTVLYDEVNGYHNMTPDEEDAVESLTPEVPEREGAIFNLAGQRLNRMQKGINIVGTKKVFVK